MTAPFNPGDRVVRVAPVIGGDVLGMHVDGIYTVVEVWHCCNMIGWRMTLAEVDSPGKAIIAEYGYIMCGPPGDYERSHPIFKSGWPCKLFALVQDNLSGHTMESLLEELSPVIQEEVYV